MTRRLRIGVIGLRFGASVHVPAFRSDGRCEITAISGRDLEKTAETARRLNIDRPFEDWTALVDSPDVDAVAIAVPPATQPQIIIRAAERGKHVFCEKPLAASVKDARLACAAVERRSVTHGIDFIFPEIPLWQRLHELLEEGAIGPVRHFAYAWRVETYASRTNADSWKSRPREGGGVLGNFVSHVFYNVEWLLGPILRIPVMTHATGARAGRAIDGTVEVEGNVTGSVSVSTDAFLGTGHRIEIYGERGTLVLHNPTDDYASGFRLAMGTRDSGVLTDVSVDARESGPDGRVAPVSRLVGRFVDAIGRHEPMVPNLSHGLRVQELLAMAESS